MDADQDVLELVRRYAPTPASVGAEWGGGLARVLPRVLEDGPDAEIVPLHFVPPPASRRARWTRLLPVAASAAVLAVAAGALVAVLPGGGAGPAGGPAGGPSFEPPAGLAAAAEVGRHQFGYRVIEQLQLDAQGRPDPAAAFAMTMRDYVAPDGRVVSYRSGQQRGCFAFGGTGTGSLGEPTRSFLAALPTDLGRLDRYLRARVSGASSRDEAVFVAVGDLLREYDALAAPRLRAALVGVLSRTPGVTIHLGDRDYLGRAAVRADFVDQRIRPGLVRSLYFDPATFRMLEERDGPNGGPTTYAGPSPAYDRHGQLGRDPERLGYPASVTVVRSERVVDTGPRSCG